MSGTCTASHMHAVMCVHVIRASGHMERFSDLMVKDMGTGECFRADHLLKDHLELLTSDPKCTPEQAKEYADVITKVIYHNHTY